jgi:hypothetical protein
LVPRPVDTLDRCRVHWLTASYRGSVSDFIRWAEGRRLGFVGVEDAGRYNQPSYALMACGAKLYHGSDRPPSKQPLVVEMDGDTCDRVGTEDFFRSLLEELPGLRATRLDLATDLEGPSLVWPARDAWLDGRYQGLIRRDSMQTQEDHSEGGGRTVYFGSPSSLLRLTVYDRRGPTRFEFRLRKERAEHAFEVLALDGIEAAWRSALTGFGSFKTDWWERLEFGRKVVGPKLVSQTRELEAVMDQIRHQYGPLLWMLGRVGVRTSELMRPKDLDELTAEERRQARLFIDGADVQGRKIDDDFRRKIEGEQS